MDLFDFLHHNWFQITLIATLVGFAIKLTISITNKLNIFNAKIESLDRKIDNNREECQNQTIELSSKIDENTEERKQQISELNGKIEKKVQLVYRDTDDRIHKSVLALDKKIDKIQLTIDTFTDKQKDTHERNILIMEGVEATLTTLHNASFNGPVTKSLENINDYKTRKAAE